MHICFDIHLGKDLTEAYARNEQKHVGAKCVPNFVKSECAQIAIAIPV